jgi:hypothetical protein
MKRRTICSDTCEGIPIDFTSEPNSEIFSKISEDRLVVTYLTNDGYPENPMDAWDGEGKLITKPSRRDSSITDDSSWGDHLGLTEDGEPNLELPLIEDQAMEFLKNHIPPADLIRLMMELDEPASKIIEYIFDEWAGTDYSSTPFTWDDEDSDMFDSLPNHQTTCERLWLELYNEGAIGTHLAVPVSWASNNHGPGTASADVTNIHNADAVWVPGSYEISNMSLKDDMTHEEKMEVAEKYAQGCLNTFIQWCNGEVYDVWTEVYDLQGSHLDYECVGGYFGYDYALEEAKVALEQKVEKEAEAYPGRLFEEAEAIRTQDGRQIELELS